MLRIARGYILTEALRWWDGHAPGLGRGAVERRSHAGSLAILGVTHVHFPQEDVAAHMRRHTITRQCGIACTTTISTAVGSISISVGAQLPHHRCEVCSCIQSKCQRILPGCTKPCRTHGGNQKKVPFPTLKNHVYNPQKPSTKFVGI